MSVDRLLTDAYPLLLNLFPDFSMMGTMSWMKVRRAAGSVAETLPAARDGGVITARGRTTTA